MKIRPKPRKQLRYILFYKPYGVLSQFTPRGNLKSLKEFGPFPPEVYPVGRLDANSEGLILLTNDDAAKFHLTDPRYKHPRTYLVQVENEPDEKDLADIRQGVVIRGKRTVPAEVTLLQREPDLPARPVPIRYRKNIPTSWIELTLYEGRNHQVRKMTAAVGHPTLRLVRTKIGPLHLAELKPGQHRDLTQEEILRLRYILSAQPALKRDH